MCIWKLRQDKVAWRAGDKKINYVINSAETISNHLYWEN